MESRSVLHSPPTTLRRIIPRPLRRALHDRLAAFRYHRRRLALALRIARGDARPITNGWDGRGLTIHRAYLERFLEDHAGDIRGHCLEFMRDHYASRFGGTRLTGLDILHREPGNPHATLVADLLGPDADRLPAGSFDCILCTYVLHQMPTPQAAVPVMHRMLRPGGVLLVAVPDITINYPEFAERWRITEHGLHSMLADVFGEPGVRVRTYGNALTAIAELYGLGTRDCAPRELEHHDRRYPLVVCARAVKEVQPGA